MKTRDEWCEDLRKLSAEAMADEMNSAAIVLRTLAGAIAASGDPEFADMAKDFARRQLAFLRRTN